MRKLYVVFFVLSLLIFHCGVSSQTLWNSSGTGGAWLTASNWTPATVPITTGYAQFQLNPTTTGQVGINMNNPTNNGTSNQAVGGIEVTGARAVPLVIGNSTTAAAGVLTLTGTTINTVSNVVLRNNTGQLFTIQQNVGTGTSGMTMAIANATDNIINIDGTGGVAISVPITGAGKLTKAGSGIGTLVLSGANTYTGGTTISSGTLQIMTAANRLPVATALSFANTASAVFNMTNVAQTVGSLAGGGTTGGNITLGNATLTTGNATSTSYGGTISGTGAFTKVGTGTQTLTGANAYTGVTTISAGSLFVNGSTVAASAVSVASGATLGGNGTVAGTVAMGGTVAPGTAASATGTLATGAFTFAANSTYTFEVSAVGGAAGNVSGWDLLNSTGAINVTATPITIAVTGLAGNGFLDASTYTWKIASGTSITGFNATNINVTAAGFGTYTGAFTVVNVGNELRIVYTPPSGPTAPTVTTPTVTAISNTSATLGATVTSDGGATLTERGTSFKTTTGVVATDNQLLEGGTSVSAYSHSRTLSPETRYYFVGYAINSQGTAISSESNFYTYSNPPSTQAANIVVSAISYSQIDLSWDAALFPATGATVKGYVLIRATGASIPTFTGVNGSAPTAGVGTIISSTILDPSSNFSNTALTQSTTYNYLLVPYTWDGTNAATYNYLTAGALTGSATTPVGPCTSPATQASGASSPVASLSTSLTFNWTPVAGTNSFVIISAGTPVSQAPVSGTVYSASSVFGTGDNLGSFNYICFSGAGNTVTLTNLSPSTTYYASVYSYNTTGICFNLAAPATASNTTLASGSLIETFEPGVKAAYAAGNATCNLGIWNFNDALIGTTAGSDRFVGTRSARIEAVGSITMQFDKPNGLGSISVKHALFGSDPTTTWRLDVSDDGGATFVAYQSPVQTTNSTTLNTVTFTPNITGNQIRIRIVKLSGGTSSRLNIDDIALGDYVSTNTVSTGAIAVSQYCITNATGAAINVPFTAAGVYNTGNVYTAQLSDALGYFSPGQDIGTLASTANGLLNITATIPAGTVSSSAYKVRVIASDPAINGSASATVLTINLNTPDVKNVNGGPASGQVLVGWINPTGCYNDVMVVVSTSSITCVPTGDGTAYNINPVYGGSTTPCSGSYPVYRSNGTSVIVTGLTNGVTYYFKVFVRNGTIWSTGVQITAVPNTVVDGDYQSHQSGSYGSTSTWEKRVSNAWQWPSPDLPGTGNAGTANVTINSGHSVNITVSVPNLAIKTLTVNGTLYGGSASNTYITVYGDIVCNGTIGLGSATFNSLCFNMEGSSSTISGIGAFNVSRIRKQFSLNTVSNLIIAMDVNLLWNTSSGTGMYNNASVNKLVATTFNVTVNKNSTLSCINLVSGTGNMAINGTAGNGNGTSMVGNNYGAGTFTVNGTMNIPGILYATSSNPNSGSSCNWIIGTTGVINCNQLNCDASGAGRHTFTIVNGGRLNINTTVGFNTATASSFSATNNTYDLQAGSIVEYSAPGGITHVLTDLTYSNLVISGSGTKDFIQSNLSQTGITLTVNKNLTITGSSVLDPSNPGLTNPSNAINVGGDWNNYATAGFNEAFSNVTFNGVSGAQKIYCPAGENFYNMTVSNTNATGAELNTDVSVANNLDLGTNGRLFFGLTPNILKLTNMTAASNCFIGSGTALVDISQSASTMYIGCQTPGYSGGFNAGTTSLVNYYRDNAVSGSGGTQDVLTAITYANLSVSGSDLKNTAANFTVNADFTVDGSSTSLEATAIGKTLTLGGNLTLSGGGTMGGASGTSCLNNLSIVTAAASASKTQTFNGGFNYINAFNLTTDKAATFGINLNAGNTGMAISNILTQATGAQLSPNDNRVKIGSAWSIWGAAGFNKGTSAIEYNGAGAETVIAVNYYDLESSSTGTRTMASTGTVGIANIFTPFTNAYTFTGSTVDYNGSIDQNIAAFTANPTTIGRTYNNLTLSNSGIKFIIGNTDVEGALSLNNTITLSVQNNFVNLKSTATQTARVAPVATGAIITYGASGSFVVERYFPGRRAWRMITAPVTTKGTNSIFNSWQVGGPTGASSPVGSGTYVTGLTPGSNGMDISPVVSQPSLKTFNTSTTNWDPVASTLTTLISGTTGTATVPDNKAFFMFVRGDRTPSNTFAFSPYNVVNETTLRDTGKIQVQSYQFAATPSIGVNRYTAIGNPYASPVDFTSLTRSGVANKFWAWDPKLNLVGGYVINDLALGMITTVPAGGSTTQASIIQSKQAIVIETTNASLPTITFNEAAKSSTNDLLLFRPSTPPVVSIGSVAVNLHTVNADGTIVLADGVLAQFRQDFSDSVDELDGLKWSNINETFSILQNGQYYMLQRRKPVQLNDTIFLNLKRSRQINYRFNVMFNGMVDTRLSGYLEDKYLHTSTPVNMEGSTAVDFNLTADAGSKSPDRFYIVFKKAISFTSILAAVQNADIAVNWSVTGEDNINHFEVEKSVDGNTFTAIATALSKGSNPGVNTYNMIDDKPASGIYYYRIKAFTNNGAIAYSDKVMVKMMNNKTNLYVYPNPVSNGTIGLQLNSQPAGKYAVRLLNTIGQSVVSQQVIHPGGTASHSIAYPAILSGAYQLEVTAPDKKQTVIKIVIQ